MMNNPSPTTMKEHDFEINSLGGNVCKNCGAFGTVPQWPQYCQPSEEKPSDQKECIVCQGTENNHHHIFHDEECKPARAEWEKGFDKLFNEKTTRFGEYEYIKSFISDLLSSEKQSLYELIKEKMPEKRKRTKELVKGKSDMEFVKYGYNKAISDVTKALSEIFESKDSSLNS